MQFNLAEDTPFLRSWQSISCKLSSRGLGALISNPWSSWRRFGDKVESTVLTYPSIQRQGAQSITGQKKLDCGNRLEPVQFSGREHGQFGTEVAVTTDVMCIFCGTGLAGPVDHGEEEAGTTKC